MNPTGASQTGNALRRYLLGELGAEERGAIERRLMTDSQFLDELSRAEEELIDEYARGDLDPREKQEFEALFLAVPERREKVAFAQAFQRYLVRHDVASVTVSPPRWRPALIASLAVVVLMLAFASAFLYREAGRLRQQLASAESRMSAAVNAAKAASDQLAQQQGRNQDLQDQLAALRAPALEDTVVLALSSGWNRSSDPTPLANLSSSTKRLRLDLILPRNAPSYKSYNVQLQTVEGAQVWSKMLSHNAGRSVSVVVPASKLLVADYLVVLNGAGSQGKTEELATYYFRVQRK